MEIKNIIGLLEEQGSWVDWQRTRDMILHGRAHRDVDRMGVCWVATRRAIEEAVRRDIHFIISHENPFYQCSTATPRLLREEIQRKKELLDAGDITVYRSHDVWDKLPRYGVADRWADRLGFPFQRKTDSYLQFAEVEPMTVKQLAEHIACALTADGEDGVYALGDVDRTVRRISMGTGAATDIFAMLQRETDVLIVSDDGITNYTEGQYVLDRGIPMIVVNHAGCEICGLKGMKEYFQEVMPKVETVYLEEGYRFRYFIGRK